MNTHYTRNLEELDELIADSRQVEKLAKQTNPDRHGNVYSIIYEGDRIQKLLMNSIQLIRIIFRENSDLYKEIIRIKNNEKNYYASTIRIVRGTLESAKGAIQKGYLTSFEFLISADIFDSTLEQAKELLKNGYKDPAAMLCRVVIEDSLKKIARKDGIETEKKKASVLNDELKNKEFYNQIQWREVQKWLDIGNAAAHGQFDEIKKEDVQKMINEIEHFILNYMRG
jgi:HEPN domain-containing protein